MTFGRLHALWGPISGPIMPLLRSRCFHQQIRLEKYFVSHPLYNTVKIRAGNSLVQRKKLQEHCRNDVRDIIQTELQRENRSILKRRNRDPNEETLAVPSLYRRTVTIHGREFQQYSVENSIHLVPIDEVRFPNSWNFTLSCGLIETEGRSGKARNTASDA